MSQAKGLVPLCERRTWTSRPCGVEKTWGKRVHTVKFAREKRLGESHTQRGRKGSLPCCTSHTCKSQRWWAVGDTRGQTPLWCHLAPSPAAAQAAFQHRVQELLLAAAQTAPEAGSWSHHRVPGKSYTQHRRGRARSRGRRRAPGLRSAPASGRACSFAQGAGAPSHPGCSTCTAWRAPRKGVLHLGMGTQISPRLWKHKDMGIGVLHDPDTILRQNSLSVQVYVLSLTTVLNFEAVLSSQWEYILYCSLGRVWLSSTTYLPSVPAKLFKANTSVVCLHLWIPGCVHTDLTSKTLNTSVCNFL